MAKRTKTNIVDDNKYLWEGERVEVESTTKLQDDHGIGNPLIIRAFEFRANPQAFKLYTPTAQQLFNYHYKGIEAMLWSDGLIPVEGIEPRLIFSKGSKDSKSKKGYRIFITCMPLRGQTVLEKPLTLSEIANPKIVKP